MNKQKMFKLDNFHKFFIAFVVLKIILMGLFSSDYQNQMFMKFIGGFIDNLGQGIWFNPYNYSPVSGSLFPYPPVMLVMEAIGGFLMQAAGNSLFWRNVLFKLPSLFFDCMGMYYLMRMFPYRRKYISFLYFASPIVIYATYMHGQLDIIPTALLIAAIYYLTNRSKYSTQKFMLFLFAALGSKLHIAAVIPILFLYIVKKEGWWNACKMITIPILLTVGIILPFYGNGFLNNVLLNAEQSVLTEVVIVFVDIKLYIPILAIIILYLKTFTIRAINKDLLYSLCGILFSIFLALVPPMPGWYVWVVPFITIYFIDSSTNRFWSAAMYALLNGMYILYFAFAHQTQYVDLYYLDYSLAGLKINSPILLNMLFTTLTGVLLYLTFMMYQAGIASNSLYQRRDLPFMIGVSGDSGSGKSTFISLVDRMFGSKNLLYIEGDGDHRWERGDAMWSQFTHLNPKANFIYKQAADLATLRSGQGVKRVDYNHDTGKFTKEYLLRPKPYIMLCGLHALYLPQIRSNLDLKIYMDIDENLRRYWKIQRDVSKRGYSKEIIVDQIESRMSDAKHYIYPQKKYADLVISYFDGNMTDYMAPNHEVKLSLKLTLSAAIDIEALIQTAVDYKIQVRYDFNNDLRMQTIIFSGEALDQNTIPYEQTAIQLIPHLDEIVYQNLTVDSNREGILELVLLLLVNYKMQGGT